MNKVILSSNQHSRERSHAFATINNDESLTQQSDAAETDINVIMKRYGGNHSAIPKVIGQALYGDFTDVTDYRSMIDRLDTLNAQFLEIPADIRQRFDNDPEKFTQWVTDPKNIEDVRKAGLAPPPPTLESAPGAGVTTAPATPTPSTPSQPTPTAPKPTT